MELRALVRALLAYDALAARQWVADAARVHLDWRSVPAPDQAAGGGRETATAPRRSVRGPLTRSLAPLAGHDATPGG